MKVVVAEHEHKIVVNMFFDGEQRMGEPILFALMGVGDRNALVGVAVVVDDYLFHVADDDDEFVRTEIDQLK
ncbi:hypothetical protein JCM31271_27090 [Halorubrum trueperi]